MSIFDEFDEIEKIFKKLRKMEGGMKTSTGYSISVTYGPDGRPIVNVETYGEVDKTKLREMIQSKYPNAVIKGLEEEPLIKEVDEVDKDRGEKKDVEKKSTRKLIWEEDEE